MAGYKLHVKETAQRKTLGKPVLQCAHGGHGFKQRQCIQRIRLHTTSSANPIYRQASPHSTCVLPSIGMSLRRTREGGEGECKKKKFDLPYLAPTFIFHASQSLSLGVTALADRQNGFRA